MKVRIYSPSKSAMQSGKARLNQWLVELIEDKQSRNFDGLMGWVSVDNTRSQLNFTFSSKEEAIEFVKGKNFDFIVDEPQKVILKKKSYAENFQ